MFFRDPIQIESIQYRMKEVYESNRWSNGPYTKELMPAALAESVIGPNRGSYVFPCTNGTTAIKVWMYAYDLYNKGVIFVPNLAAAPVWIGTAYAKNLQYYGIENDWCPDLEELEVLFKSSDEEDKWLYLVHVGGVVPHDYADIYDLCQDYGVRILDDISHAQGSARDGYRAGQLGDVLVGSMYATKALTAGEGGFLTVPYADHRWVYPFWNSGRDDREKQVSYRGENARPSEFQAAIMTQMLQDYPATLQKRKELAAIYDDRLGDHVFAPSRSHDVFSYYKYPIRAAKETGATVKEFDALANALSPLNALTGLVHDLYVGGSKAIYGPTSLSDTHLCLNLFLPDGVKKKVAAIVNTMLL